MFTSRATLLVYNTIERLLRGDFFHAVQIGELRADLKAYPCAWPVVGLGTSNWYKRNGETIVGGVTEEPSFLWSDPSSDAPGAIIDLSNTCPIDADRLRTPVVGDDERSPYFPFVTFAVCDPAARLQWRVSTGCDLHAEIARRLVEDNIGLAAVRVTGTLECVDFTSICHIPLGGVVLAEGYTGDIFKSGTIEGDHWNIAGVYAHNPTIQSMISIEGHPLHLHGYGARGPRGGHVNRALTPRGGIAVEVWPVRDLVLQIRDLDVAWLPVQAME